MKQAWQDFGRPLLTLRPRIHYLPTFRKRMVKKLKEAEKFINKNYKVDGAGIRITGELNAPD